MSMQYIPPQYAGDPYAMPRVTQQGALRESPELQRHIAEMNQPVVAPQVAAPVGDGSGYGILSKEYRAKRELEDSMRKRPEESRSDYAARIGAMTTTRGQDLTNSATLRGQDLTYGATTRGQDMGNAATLRGQDMSLQGQLIPKQMEMQVQLARQAAMQGIMKNATDKDGKVDYTKAQELALQYGSPEMSESFGKLVSNIQGQTEKTQGIDKGFQEKVASRVAIPLLEDGKDTGKRNEVAEKAMVSRLLQTRPELRQLSDPQLNEVLPRLLAEQTLLEKLNAAGQNSGIGWRGEWLPSYNDRIPQMATPPAPGALAHLQPNGRGWWAGVGGRTGDTTLRDESGWDSTYNLGKLDALEAEVLRGWTTKPAKPASK